MNKPIIFLDFDGVVNTIYWIDGQHHLFHPSDGKVSNYQAVNWLNEVFRKIPFDIVVSSTWRRKRTPEQLAEFLYNGGLLREIRVIDKTPILFQPRGEEIQKWITDNNFQGKFAIVDDDSDMCELLPFLVRCDCNVGFNYYDYRKTLLLLE